MDTPFAGDSTLTYCANACRELFYRCLSNNILCAYQHGWPENQLARFDIWGDNLGLHRQGHASADYRLRNHNEVRRLLLQLLGTLHEKLSYIHQNATEEIGGDIAAVSTEDNSPHLSTVSFVLSSASSSSLDDDQWLSVSVKDACSEVKDIINRLNKLTLSIRRPYKWDQPTEADFYVVEDGDGRNLTEFYTRISTSIICRTFPSAHKTLQLRLINSLVARYNRLAYCRRQKNPTSEEDSHSFPRASLPRTSSQTPELLDKLALFDTESIDLSAHLKLEDMEFPSEPRVAVEGSFTCPYCFIPCPPEEARGDSWRNHVMEDLAAYICLFPDCTKPDQSFQTVGDWISHIQDEHTSVCWDCLSPSHDPVTFGQEEKFIDHVKQSHQNAFTDSQLPGIAAMSARPNYNLFQSCPLCDFSKSTTLDADPVSPGHQDDLQMHIINHLRSIALLSIYWLEHPVETQDRTSSQGIVLPKVAALVKDKNDKVFEGESVERKLFFEELKLGSSSLGDHKKGSYFKNSLDYERGPDLRQQPARNPHLVVSWNPNLSVQSDFQGLGVSLPSKSQTTQSSIIEDGGYSSYLADNRTSSHRLSLASSRAELVSYSDGGFANTKDNVVSGQLDTTGDEDVLKEDEDLGESIRVALQPSQSEGKQQKFLPNDSLDRIVSWQRVRHELSRHSIGPSKDLDVLAHKIWEVASPPSPSKTRPKETTRRKIFAILGLMEKLEDIVDFIDAQLYDCDLPFLLSEGPRRGSLQMDRRSKGGQHPIELFRNWKNFELESFNAYQWQLTAPYFSLSLEKTRKPQHYVLQNETILPFIEEGEGNEHRAEGGYSDVWRIKIHPAHHNWCGGLAPLDRIPSYAIKRLRHNNVIAFCNEVSNLKRFSGKSHEHLIKLLATFLWRDQFYLIFPWADGNLLDFWKLHPQPPDATKDPRMARWLSEQCLGLVDGLKSIHNGDNQKSKSGNYIHGRHGDLKPENILWFKDRTDERSFGTLKISDFGLARFHRTQSNTMFKAVAISRTYRPPEYDIAHMVSQSFDIWTLGCLLLEFVTWYLFGWEEIESFSMERAAEDRRELREDVFFHSMQIMADDGVLTLGAKAKQSVVDEFQKLYEHERCSEFIFDLLEYIEKSLLRIGPRKRANCEKIFQQFTKIHRECLEDQSYCIDRLQAVPKRSGTDLSELSASTLNLGPNIQDALRKVNLPQHTGPLVDWKGKLPEKATSTPPTTQPRPLASIYRTATVQSSHGSSGNYCPTPQSPSRKVVHFTAHGPVEVVGLKSEIDTLPQELEMPKIKSHSSNTDWPEDESSTVVGSSSGNPELASEQQTSKLLPELSAKNNKKHKGVRTRLARIFRRSLR